MSNEKRYLSVDILYQMLLSCRRVIKGDLPPEHVNVRQILYELLATEPSEETISERAKLLSSVADVISLKILRWKRKISGHIGLAWDLPVEKLAEALPITPVVKIDVFSPAGLVLSLKDRMKRHLPSLPNKPPTPPPAPQKMEPRSTSSISEKELIEFIKNGKNPFDNVQWKLAVRRATLLHRLIEMGKIKLKTPVIFER